MQLEEVRRFGLWEETHRGTADLTVDCSFEGGHEELREFINEINYEKIKAYYLKGRSSQLYFGGFGQETDERVQARQFVGGVTILLRACLGRIIDLRREEVKLSNAILICMYAFTHRLTGH
jgi:hypothetical protein